MPVILGQEIDKKKGLLLLGVIVAGVAIVVYVRSRGGAGEPAGAAPQAASGPDYGAMGGGGGGYTVQAPSDTAASNYNTALQDIQLQVARFGLEQQAAQGAEQKRQWDLQDTLQGAYNQMQMAVFGQNTQVGEAAARYGAEQYRTAEAAQAIATKQVTKKGKIECPVGQHFVVGPDGTSGCQQKGGGGLSFKAIFAPVGEFLRGVTQAAPGLGYSAAQGYAGQYLPGQPKQPRRASTPPLASYGGNYA